MVRHLRLWLLFMRQHLLGLMEYKADFLVGVISYLFRYVGEVAMISFLFANIKALAGWSFHQVLFIYGFAAIPRAFNLLLFDSIWMLPRDYIQNGQLDRLLIRPLNPYFHLLGERFGHDGIGVLAIAIGIISYSAANLGLQLGPLDYLLFVIFSLAGSLIYMATNLFAASCGFYFVRVQELMMFFWSLNLFGTYPINIFIPAIRYAILFVIPFAMAGFVPASFFLGVKEYSPYVLLVIPVAVLFSVGAYQFFKRGLRRYSSTGS